MNAGDLDTLIGRLCDGELTDADAHTLAAALEADRAARDRVRLHLVMADRISAAVRGDRSDAAFDQSLRVRLAAQHDAQFTDRVRAAVQRHDAVTHARRRRMRLDGMVALAAMITLAALAWVMTPDVSEPGEQTDKPAPKPVAMLTASHDAVFAESAGPMHMGRELAPGVLKLAAGSAQVIFHSGAVIDLDGPCEFKMEDAGRGTLRHGRLHAYVPKRARGFIVDAPGVRLVDLGTQFVVDVDPNGLTQTQVIEGVVRLTAKADGAMRTLAAGASMRIVDGRFIEDPLDDLPATQPNAHIAIAGLRLFASEPVVAGPGPRSIFTQTLPVDPTRRLESITLSAEPANDAGGDAEFGVYAVTLTTPRGEPVMLPLGSLRNRITLADPASPPTNGWRNKPEWFNRQSLLDAVKLTPAGHLETAPGVTFRLPSAEHDEADEPDTWIIPVGQAAAAPIPSGTYARLSVLYSAVGFNPVGDGPNNGGITLHYDDDTAQQLPWDLADSNGAGLDTAATSHQIANPNTNE